MRIALNRAERLGQLDPDADGAPPLVALCHRHRIADDVGQRNVFNFEPDRPDEREHFLDDDICHLGFFDDVRQDVLCVGGGWELAFQNPGHDLDACEGILDFVRDRRRHLAERGQPIAQPLALLELLDPRQVLEKQRGADVASARILHQ